MKKQDSVKLSLNEAEEVSRLLRYAHIAIKDEKDSETDFPNFEKFATVLENKVEECQSSELVYVSFNGYYPAYYCYWNKEIKLEKVFGTQEFYDVSTDEFYEALANYLEKIGMKDHAEYVKDNKEELEYQYHSACRTAHSESQEFELEKLKADMLIGGGYGEDSANAAAYKRINELETNLGYSTNE